MKLWSGSFSKDTDMLTDEFNASIPFDSRLWKEDIEGSLAHASMLVSRGIISQEDGEKIREGLLEIADEIEQGKAEFTLENEDIHMNIESLLTAKIGDAGKRLHTARSRNDQVALDLRLYVKKEILEIKEELLTLLKVLAEKASLHRDTVMPGYTHLQRAQPVSFAEHLLSYAEMFMRDVTRLEDTLERMDLCPLGSGALAGTTYPIDRRMTAEALGFRGPVSNSMDGVSDRDYCLELLSDLSILMMHLSRFSEEIILWVSWEFRFVELDEAYSTGSSIMPQKKNPDVAELVRGKTGRVYGDLMGLLTVMKGLPLSYNKDMQEDKEPVFDAVDTVETSLRIFTRMVDTMKVNGENMRKAAGKGFINATDLADYLAKKGMPFRDAYTLTGRIVKRCTLEGITLEEMPLGELRTCSELFDEDVYESIRLENAMAMRKSRGGPAPEETLRQTEEVFTFIEGHTSKEE